MRQCRVPVQVRVQVHPGLLELAVRRLLRVSLRPEKAPRCQQGEPHPQPALVLLPALQPNPNWPLSHPILLWRVVLKGLVPAQALLPAEEEVEGQALLPAEAEAEVEVEVEVEVEGPQPEPELALLPGPLPQ